jgi:prepilin-type processing-associated H-X9-DG protein
MANATESPVWQIFKWGFLLIFGLGFVFSLFMPISGPREPSRRMQCLNQVRNIALALQNYHANYGSFPPACITDESGRPMHSWRVLILPYLDRHDVYEAYSFDEPWNGPNNSKLQDVVISVFCCPQDHGRGKSTVTSYVAVVGPETIWPGSSCTKFDDVSDGLDNTLLIVEVANSGIHWMEPRDLDASKMPLTVNARSGLGISSAHPGGAAVGFADGRVKYLSDQTPAKTIAAILTIRGGEKIPEFDR